MVRATMHDSPRNWLCRIGLHRYRHVWLRVPPGSLPEPTNPYELARFVQQCRRCGKRKRPVVSV